MNILVLNGSPKGNYSITLHTVLYLKELYPQDTFEILHVGQKIRSFEKDFTEAKTAYEPNEAIDKMVASLEYALTHKNTQPQNFYGVGGMKIFRDLIYQMQGMMKADYKFFKAHGQFDFPQNKKGTILAMYLVGAMLSNKKLKAKIGNNMNAGMVMPYRKVIEDLKKK